MAEALCNDITGGKFRVGDLLPSEPQLSERFGVSRHTVRAALRTLQQRGLVSSQQGVGTLVQETRLATRYSHAFDTAEDLLQYARSTPMRMVAREEVTLGAETARRFGCKAGEHWWRARTVRTDPSGRAVVGVSDIYIPLAFGAVLDEGAKGRQPIFSLISERFGEPVLEIQQEIACLRRLPAADCALLKVPRGSPALEITRRYLGRQGRVLEVTRSVHPSDTFKYAMRLQLQSGSLP